MTEESAYAVVDAKVGLIFENDQHEVAPSR